MGVPSQPLRGALVGLAGGGASPPRTPLGILRYKLADISCKLS